MPLLKEALPQSVHRPARRSRPTLILEPCVNACDRLSRTTPICAIEPSVTRWIVPVGPAIHSDSGSSPLGIDHQLSHLQNGESHERRVCWSSATLGEAQSHRLSYSFRFRSATIPFDLGCHFVFADATGHRCPLGGLLAALDDVGRARNFCGPRSLVLGLLTRKGVTSVAGDERVGVRPTRTRWSR